MKDNRTGQTCEHCGSHIIKYKNEQGKIVYECSYCGVEQEELDEFELDDEDEQQENEDLFKLW